MGYGRFQAKGWMHVQPHDAAPAELAHVRGMRESGILRDVFVSAPGHARLVPPADDRSKVDRVLRDVPLYRYVETIVDPMMN
jgi:hypothetical protein